jgi:acyl carrier protein
MIFESVRRLFLTPEQKVAEFCEGRSKKPDADFLSGCLLPGDPDDSRVAISVRRAIAKVGKVDPEFIKAEDKYPNDLGKLPMWDSIDWVAFFLELEEELGLTITDKEIGTFFVPRSTSGISVREMVARIYAIIKNKK